MSHREYNREWMRNKRAEQYRARDLENGKCPVCSMLLTSVYHINCPYLEE